MSNEIQVGAFWKENCEDIMEYAEVFVIAHVGVNVAVMHPEGNYSSWDIKCFLRNHTQVADAEGTPLEPEREKYVLYPVVKADDGSLKVTFGNDTYSYVSDLPCVTHDGRYCIGYTDRSQWEPTNSRSPWPVDIDGNLYRNAIFVDPEAKA